ncbi:hypothetical protein [Nonomuraea dietziae]|uniref:hypothetical protein n=1 Tax=Nonomuraea dietziae TaxID=65515 RepID=UPI0034313A0E
MTLVNWERLPGETVEEFVAAMLLLLRHPHGNRITPSRGDRGVDIRVANPDGYDIYQVKRFCRPLTSRQVTDVEHSWQRFVDETLPVLPVRSWTLVTPSTTCSLLKFPMSCDMGFHVILLVADLHVRVADAVTGEPSTALFPKPCLPAAVSPIPTPGCTATADTSSPISPSSMKASSTGGSCRSCCAAPSCGRPTWTGSKGRRLGEGRRVAPVEGDRPRRPVGTVPSGHRASPHQRHQPRK